MLSEDVLDEVSKAYRQMVSLSSNGFLSDYNIASEKSAFSLFLPNTAFLPMVLTGPLGRTV
jgi:hypothetical protein